MQNNWILEKSTNLPWHAKIDLLEATQIENKDCYILAQNDIEAVKVWVTQFKETSTTRRAYEKEAERLLLWCRFEKGMRLSALKVEDFEEYFNFLQNPPRHWQGTKQELRAKRYSLKWRPLVAPLKKTSLLFAVRVINSLINYLVDARYLKFNPIKLIKKYRNLSNDLAEQKYKVWARMLEEDEWSAVEEVLQNLPEATPKEQRYKLRTQMLFGLLYLLGLRIHEVANATWGSFRKINGNWWFFVQGKGGKLGHVPVNEQLLSIIKIYRLSLNKISFPEEGELEPIFTRAKTNRPLSVRQLFTNVKEIGIQAAQKFNDNLSKKQKLEKLSPHWLRHLSASHQDLAGISSTMIQANHRHGSYSTTQIYLHAPDELRHQAMDKLQIKITPSLYDNKIKPITKDIIIRLELIGNSIVGVDSLIRLISSIENNILIEFKWMRVGELLETLDIVNRYQEIKDFKLPIEICYRLESALEIKKLSEVKTAILKEAEIRLFKCTISIQSIKAEVTG